MNLKQFVLMLLGSIVVLIAACGGEDSTLVLPTSTPFPIQSTPVPFTPTPTIPAYDVGGEVLASSTSFLAGGTFTVEPFEGTTDTEMVDPSRLTVNIDPLGVYLLPNIPDGFYTATVTPKCVAYGCFLPSVLVVAGSDVLEFNMAPFPAALLQSGPPIAWYFSMTSSRMLSLDEIEFAVTSLVMVGQNDLQAGESSRMVLAGPACLRCADLFEVVTPVEWSVSPSTDASIEAETGLVTISDDAPVGSKFTVTADVGKFVVSKTVTVYSEEGNPLAGIWTELDTGNVNRLVITSGGEFAVTVNPYGNYQDYWGFYTFEVTDGDVATGEIELTADGANQVAPDGQGTGTFSINAVGNLVLESICLGQWDAPMQSLIKNCEHEFQKLP
jgi:hypothetical protein